MLNKIERVQLFDHGDPLLTRRLGGGRVAITTPEKIRSHHGAHAFQHGHGARRPDESVVDGQRCRRQVSNMVRGHEHVVMDDARDESPRHADDHGSQADSGPAHPGKNGASQRHQEDHEIDERVLKYRHDDGEIGMGAAVNVSDGMMNRDEQASSFMDLS